MGEDEDAKKEAIEQLKQLIAEHDLLITEHEHELSGEGGPPFEWRGEYWLAFAQADRQIAAELEMSRGVAARTLRELCAKGDVRSIRVRWSDPYDPPISVQPVKPSEWLGELDLECDWLSDIKVSTNDLEYWLAKQPNRKPQEKIEWHTIDKNSLPPELRDAYDKALEAQRKWVQIRKKVEKTIRMEEATPRSSAPLDESVVVRERPAVGPSPTPLDAPFPSPRRR